MCPFCLTTAAIVAGSATGTSGLTALVAGTFLKRARRAKLGEVETQDQAKEVEHGDDRKRSEGEERGIA